MAVFEPNLTKKIRKRMGDLVFYQLNGQSVVRRTPGKVRDPKTPKQLAHRARMKTMGDYAAAFAEAYVMGFPERERGQSPCSAFQKMNFPLVEGGGEYPCPVRVERVACSAGSLVVPEVEVSATGGVARFVLKDQAMVALAEGEDRVVGVLFHAGQMDTRARVLGRRDEVGTVEWALPGRWREGVVHVYLFTLSADGSRASNTVYGGRLEDGEMVPGEPAREGGDDGTVG